MRILPVLDLMGGRVVRGVGGRRHEYQPVRSRLTPSCRPVDVAEAFRTHFDLSELYLADLDAIAGAAPALATYGALRERGFRLWVDAGVRDAATARPLAAPGVERVIVGLETVAGPAALAQLVAEFPIQLAFSLDLKDGLPLGHRSAWDEADAGAVAARAVALGVRSIVLLDLARVGGGEGTGTEALCRQLIAAYPHVEVLTGGGVRGAEDLRRLQAWGVSGVLVASALHDGRLTADDLAGL